MTMELFNEIIILLVVLCLVALYMESVTRHYVQIIGWVCVGLVCICIAMNAVMVLPCRFKATCLNWGKACKKKKKPIKAVVRPVTTSQVNFSLSH